MAPDIKAGRRTWDEFAAACTDDKPMPAALSLMRMLSPLYQQVVMSGSSECMEAWNWLDDHQVMYDLAFFRQAGDNTESGLLKARWIEELREAGLEVVLFVEDVPEIAEVIRQETGVPVLVVNPCYPSFADKVLFDQQREGGALCLDITMMQQD
jgi:hypothetical protein